ncbi:hypothetical protein KP003_16735 [Geomonas nitrogeniifigens]|uniref:hypothetical protein n=1 Tax=Geomonas diazotrophica TaxID=2843197 RepID=UPI001C2B9CEE|nr:hypothetical protein [Geomonas nitrogeniifigens]QXE85988.1 hypothetical protein KP003_16735 [Geomonas nitrogeniifigens]
MSAEVAKHAVKTLTAQFKKQFTEKGMRDIWPELIAQPDKAIEAAVDGICLTMSYLPPPDRLLERVKQEAKKIANEQAKQREDEWNKQKGGSNRTELDKQPNIFSREMSDMHGKHAIQALKLMLTDQPESVKLDCLRAMETSYPGVGYGKAGIELQRVWGEDKAG